MFNHINKKASFFFIRVFKVPVFQVRTKITRLHKGKKPIDTTSKKEDETLSNLSPDTTQIKISFEKLQKELGLTLKDKTKSVLSPKIKQVQKLSKLEKQLEDITNLSFKETDLKEEVLKKKLESNFKPHAVSKAYEKIETLDSNDKNAIKNRKNLEKQLSPIDMKVNSLGDLKFSPSEILMKKFEENEQKKKDRSEYQIANYVEGEEGIDYLTVPSNVTEELDKKVEYLKEGFEKIYSKFMGENYYRNQMKKLEWMEKKKINLRLKELDNFEEKEYPGSTKGAHPEDDPEFYKEWYRKNAPPVLVEAAEQYMSLKNNEENEGPSGENLISTPANFVSSNSSLNEHFLQDPFEELANSSSHIIMKSQSAANEMDIYPDQEMMEWNQNVEHVERWTIFRMFPQFLKLNEYMLDFLNGTEKLCPQEKEIIVPSLYRYYNLLPEFARESIMVKNLVRAFEFTKPGMSIRDKELSLNFICRFTLPMDELTQEVVNQAIISYKHFITEEDEDKILNDPEPDLAKNEDEEEDGELELDLTLSISKKDNKKEIHDIAQELEEEEKARQKKIKKEFKAKLDKDLKDPLCDLIWKYNMWNRPIRIDPEVPEEDPNPNLPLEFYDNDDGFWNDFIKEKERKYDLYPMIHHRPYFKH